jgi:hypothetical protein
MVDDELATAVGRVVMQAAWVDEALSDLAFEFQRGPGVDRSGVTGVSGKQLVDQLRVAGAAAWADEYSALNEKRNSVVHGRWSEAIRPGYMLSVKTLRKTPGIGLLDATTWGPGELEGFHAVLQDFCQRIVKELFDKLGITDPQTVNLSDGATHVGAVALVGSLKEAPRNPTR